MAGAAGMRPCRARCSGALLRLVASTGTRRSKTRWLHPRSRTELLANTHGNTHPPTDDVTNTTRDTGRRPEQSQGIPSDLSNTMHPDTMGGLQTRQVRRSRSASPRIGGWIGMKHASSPSQGTAAIELDVHGNHAWRPCMAALCAPRERRRKKGASRTSSRSAVMSSMVQSEIISKHSFWACSS